MKRLGSVNGRNVYYTSDYIYINGTDVCIYNLKTAKEAFECCKKNFSNFISYRKEGK